MEYKDLREKQLHEFYDKIQNKNSLVFYVQSEEVYKKQSKKQAEETHQNNYLYEKDRKEGKIAPSPIIKYGTYTIGKEPEVHNEESTESFEDKVNRILRENSQDLIAANIVKREDSERDR